MVLGPEADGDLDRVVMGEGKQAHKLVAVGRRLTVATEAPLANRDPAVLGVRGGPIADQLGPALSDAVLG